MYHAGVLYKFPYKIAERYRVPEESVDAADVFAGINKKYTRPGALLRGIRIRKDLTQIQMAKRIKVTQSDISQMENGAHSIGRAIAKRIEKQFGVDYGSFLE
jgi:DNA-binding XRE family transcriptional regulator